MGQLYSSDSQGINPQYIWFGQVVDESTWVENNAKESGDHIPGTRDDIQGYGYRYKVRIFGRDLPDKEEGTPDEQLYMATATIPVTAGSGIGGAIQTPQLKQGSYVYGFWMDGIQATEPIITSILPNNAQTRLFGGDPDKGFVPRSGYKGKSGDKPVSGHNILIEGGEDHVINESVNKHQISSIRDTDIPDDASPANWVPSTFDCDGPSGPLQNVQIVLKKVFYFINKIKSLASSWAGAMSDLQNAMTSIIQDGAIIVTNLIKDILDRVRGTIIKELDKIAKPIVGSLPPNLTPIANEATSAGTTAIDCLINKIIQALFDFIFKSLSKVADKIVNPVSCAIENFVGSLLAKILGTIAGSIDSIFGGVLKSLESISGGGLSIGGISLNDVLNVINGILKFLSCEEDRDCSAGKEWSIFYGAESISESIQTDLSKVVSNIRAVGSSSGGGGGSCNTAPVACGPPSISVSGGGGIGALANPIISASGSIIGVDLISPGVGYKSPPNVYLSDPCGSGRGAKLIGILSPSLPGSVPIGNTGGNKRTTPSSVNDDGISSKSKIDGSRQPKDSTTTGVGVPVVCGKRYVVSTESGDPTRFRSYLSTLNRSRNDVEFIYTTIIDPDTQENVRLQIFSGGINGIPVKCGSNGGTPLVDSLGNPIVVDGTAEPVFAGGTGGTQVTTTDGFSVFAGGTGGVPIVDTTVLPSENLSEGKVNTDDDLLGGIDRSISVDGIYEGNGTYNNGRFDGFGVFTGEDGTKVEASFSGFDKKLDGFGEGVFNGTGSLKLGRVKGVGIFTPNPRKDTKTESVKDQDGTIRGEIKDGTRFTIFPDGTGNIIPRGTQDPISVIYAKTGSKNGIPIYCGNTQITDCDGNLVTVGGDGGNLIGLLKDAEIGCILNPGGEPITVNGLPLSSNVEESIPLCVGLPSSYRNKTEVKCGATTVKTEPNGGGNILYTIGSVSGNVSDLDTATGVFAGPDGVPLENILVLNGGLGFLSKPDGSTGGAGSRFSNPNSTVKFSDISGYSVYPPDTDIPVVEGNLIFMPNGTEANVYSNDGDLVQSLKGKGQTTPIPINGDGTITTPKYDEEEQVGELPTSNGAYPVILQLKDVLILNPGGNYKTTDPIIISPSNGAELVPEYDKFGSLVGVEIANPGIGFTETPTISVESTSGINAYAIPLFETIRVGDSPESENIIPENVELIEVIDCVGKIT